MFAKGKAVFKDEPSKVTSPPIKEAPAPTSFLELGRPGRLRHEEGKAGEAQTRGGEGRGELHKGAKSLLPPEPTAAAVSHSSASKVCQQQHMLYY